MSQENTSAKDFLSPTERREWEFVASNLLTLRHRSASRGVYLHVVTRGNEVSEVPGWTKQLSQPSRGPLDVFLFILFLLGEMAK